MNYMKDVTQLLGVEIGEEFKIEGHSGNVKYRLTEENLEYLSCGHWFSISSTLNNLLNGQYKVAKIPILDETEQKYLLHIIRPFRDKVQYITKIRYCTSEEIFIGYKGSPDDVSISNIVLPYFDSGTMYKGMKAGKDYTLEELGL